VPSTCELWQFWCSLTFSDLWSHHCEGSVKNSCLSFSLWPPGTAKELPFKSCTLDHKAAMMRYGILQRLCPISQCDWEGITKIKSNQDLSWNKTHILWEDGSAHRGTTQESLQLPWSLSATSVSIRCSLERSVVYCESWWWVKWNCRCTHTHVATSSSSSTSPCGGGAAAFVV
jgi:hypothetical protein